MISSALLTCFTLLGSNANAAEPSTLTARMLCDHPGLRLGDYAQAREEWLAGLEAAPDGPLAMPAAVLLLGSDVRSRVALDPDRLAALIERVPDVLAADALRALESIERTRRVFRSEAELPADPWPRHLRHFAVLGPLGPFDRQAPLRQPPALDVAALEPLADAVVANPAGERPTWRALERHPRSTRIYPGRLIHPPDVGETWLLAFVRADAGPALLHIETEATFQAWWNGQQCLDVLRAGWDELSPFERARVEVAAEWNCLLVRLESDSQTEIAVALSTLAGEHLAAEDFDFGSDDPWPSWSRSTTPGEPLPFDPLAGFDTEDPFSLTLSMLLDADIGRSDRALARPRPNDDSPAAAAWWRARHYAVARASHLPHEVSRRLSIEAESALEALGVEYVDVTAARIERELDEDRVAEAALLAESMLAAAPDSDIALGAMILVEDRLDRSRTLSTLRLRECVERSPESAWLHGELAERARQRGHVDEHLAETLVALELDGTRERNAVEAFTALADAGESRAEELWRLFERWGSAQDDPERVAQFRRQLLDSSARWDEERAALAARLAQRPWDHGLRNDLAHQLLEHDADEAAARELLRQVVQRHPGWEYERDRLALMGVPDAAETFFAEFAPDRDAALARRNEAPTDSSTAMLLDSGLIYFHADGSSHARFHSLEVARDRTGTEALHEHDARPFTRVARVLDGTGVIFEPVRVDETWVMPALDAGDVVELVWDEYASTVEGAAPQASFHFASFEKPFMLSRLCVFVPDGLPGELRAYRLAENEVSHEQIRWREGTVHLFETHDQPRREPEVLMPPPQELLPVVHWGRDVHEADALAYWREELAQRSSLAQDLRVELEALVASLPTGTTVEERCLALHDIVLARVLDWEESGDTTDVWTLRRGDPIGLFAALFTLAEVPFEWAVLQPQLSPELEPESGERFRGLDQFGTPLLRVITGAESAPLWVMPRRGVALGRIPEWHEGARAYVLEEIGFRVETLPRASQGEPTFGTDVAVTYTLAADGSAEARGVIANTLVIGAQIREQIGDLEPDQREQVGRRFVSQFVPGIELTHLEFEDLERDGAVLRIAFAGSVPGFLEGSGDERTVRMRIPPLQLAAGLGGADRTWPLALRVDGFRCDRLSTRLVLAEGMAAEPAVESARVEREGFLHELAVERFADGLAVTRTLIMRGATVAADEVAGLLADCERLDEAVGVPVRIRARR